MLPRALSSLSTVGPGGSIVPHYLGERDHPWLRALLDEHERFTGRRRVELRERLKEPLPVRAPKAKLRFVARLLESLSIGQPSAAVPPREARWLAFRAATRRPIVREEVLREVAGELGVTPAELEASLLADLESERLVSALPSRLNPAGLAAEANLGLVGSLLRRALRVRVTAWGNTRALVRQARLTGLICVVRAAPARERDEPRAAGFDVLDAREPNDGVLLDISGPFALFRHTTLYGRALAALVPRAAWCHRFELVAECVLGRAGETAELVIRDGDPIGSGREPSRLDSRLEERFERDFRRAAPAWDLVREPRPIEAGGTLVFPDFELVHRRAPERRWLLEIAGFWTPDYLATKLRRLREAALERFVLCIDERRSCSDAELPREAALVRYKHRIDPRRVLAVIDPDVAGEPGRGIPAC